MADPKTDSSGQIVQPRVITHFGDGTTPLTNRDISGDLKALIDDSVKGLMRSIGDAGATPTNITAKTVLQRLEDIRAAVAAGLGVALAGKIVAGTVVVPAQTQSFITYQPGVGEVWQFTFAYIRLADAPAGSNAMIYTYLGTPVLQGMTLHTVTGANPEAFYAAPSPIYLNNTEYLKMAVTNNEAAVNRTARYEIHGVKII